MKKVLAMTNERLGLVVAVRLNESDNPDAVIMNSRQKFGIAALHEIAGGDEQGKRYLLGIHKLAELTQIIEDPTLKVEDCVIPKQVN